VVGSVVNIDWTLGMWLWCLIYGEQRREVLVSTQYVRVLIEYRKKGRECQGEVERVN
jgi:hypothetical protein